MCWRSRERADLSHIDRIQYLLTKKITNASGRMEKTWTQHRSVIGSASIRYVSEARSL
jgi:hypothetical protein